MYQVVYSQYLTLQSVISSQYVSFTFALSLDENGKDQGVNVRQKVKEIVEFVQDDDRLREERKKAKKNKDKYVGVSSNTMGYKGYCK